MSSVPWAGVGWRECRRARHMAVSPLAAHAASPTAAMPRSSRSVSSAVPPTLSRRAASRPMGAPTAASSSGSGSHPGSSSGSRAAACSAPPSAWNTVTAIAASALLRCRARPLAAGVSGDAGVDAGEASDPPASSSPLIHAAGTSGSSGGSAGCWDAGWRGAGRNPGSGISREGGDGCPGAAGPGVVICVAFRDADAGAGGWGAGGGRRHGQAARARSAGQPADHLPCAAGRRARSPPCDELPAAVPPLARCGDRQVTVRASALHGQSHCAAHAAMKPVRAVFAEVQQAGMVFRLSANLRFHPGK